MISQECLFLNTRGSSLESEDIEDIKILFFVFQVLQSKTSLKYQNV